MRTTVQLILECSEQTLSWTTFRAFVDVVRAIAHRIIIQCIFDLSQPSNFVFFSAFGCTLSSARMLGFSVSRGGCGRCGVVVTGLACDVRSLGGIVSILALGGDFHPGVGLGNDDHVARTCKYLLLGGGLSPSRLV